MHSKIVFIIFVLFSMQSYAGKWPIATSVTIKEKGRLELNAEMVEIGAAADTKLGDNNYWGYAGIVTRQGRMPGVLGSMMGSCIIIIPKSFQTQGKTYEETIAYAYRACSKRIQVYDEYSSCIGYALFSPYQLDWDQVYSPIGTCFQLADVNQWCSLTTPELNINHGVISVKEAAGNRAKQTMNINCTIPSKVTLTLLGGKDTIPIGGGTSYLTSSLGVLGKEISLQAGNNSVDIISELNNVKEGEWNASAVMMMELN
ncbi:PapG chaperone-binding domain-containing protein [Erwinia persicina]|uniref:PapG chaperone-binding domain-containing protein n=1 Tax=Erwinia persicina TaxID=55211 RepID=UPI001783CB6C|nr:PapG chaperone-binding domain-containing protein [Erwinia persicina]MBD8214710.1 hypothetical protein [Erwinia persicina]